MDELITGHYFRRDGTPYTSMLEWAKDFEDMKIKRVAETRLWWGGWVSTVWLGLNHNWGGGKPLIFETMVFWGNSGKDLDMVRYSTEAEALAGHIAMCKRWRFPFWKLLRRMEIKI